MIRVWRPSSWLGATMSNVTLYHFTSSAHLHEILADGYLDVTDPVLEPPSDNMLRDLQRHGMVRKGGDANPRAWWSQGPPVVWLTSNPDPSTHDGWGLHVPGALANIGNADKTEIRFEVEVPANEAPKWWGWAKRNGIDLQWARARRRDPEGSQSEAQERGGKGQGGRA